jgi:hypothetical protein
MLSKDSAHRPQSLDVRGKKALRECSGFRRIKLYSRSRTMCDSTIGSVQPGKAEQLRSKQSERGETGGRTAKHPRGGESHMVR